MARTFTRELRVFISSDSTYIVAFSQRNIKSSFIFKLCKNLLCEYFKLITVVIEIFYDNHNRNFVIILHCL